MAEHPAELGSDPTAPRPPTTSKPVHSLILDTGPLIKNDPPASVLIAKAELLFTIPSVIAEIRDPATRSRVETTLLPFVTLRKPKPESLRFVQGFARRTGDLAVLSRPDLEVLALAYELECERNGGDWRLRNTPGQKGLNGHPERPFDEATSTGGDSLDSEAGAEAECEAEDGQVQAAQQHAQQEHSHEVNKFGAVESLNFETQQSLEATMQHLDLGDGSDAQVETEANASQPLGSPGLQKGTESVTGHDAKGDEKAEETAGTAETDVGEAASGDESDDQDGWITPSNLHKHKARDDGSATPAQVPQKTLQAAVLTSDYAMQNVALRMNLNLVTPSLARITRLKNWVLRCHGCFSITKDMGKQFCPSCGQPTLLRASCSTDEHGNFKIHLKSKFQWNNRGNVYSVPKPVHGSANGRLPKHTGGRNGWGRDLILAEDQKEYVRASDEQRRARKKDLMDEDCLPGILSGDRSGGGGGRIRVGAGRNVNSKKRRH